MKIYCFFLAAVIGTSAETPPIKINDLSLNSYFLYGVKSASNSQLVLNTNNLIPNQLFLSKIDDTQLNPCMKPILRDIQNLSNGSVAGIIREFSAEMPGYNWTVREGHLDVNYNGKTNPVYNSVTGTITTTFDSQKFTNASDLALVTAILHESVHAYLIAYFYTDRINAPKTYGDMVSEWEKVENPDFNDIHHHEMIRTFMKDIALSLEEYGQLKGYNLGSRFYSDLAWGGLTTDEYGYPTQIFKNIIPSYKDRERIQNVIIIEQTGIDSEGNPQNQRGRMSACQY